MLASFFSALQARHQIVFFGVTAGVGAVLARLFYFFRLNSAEATAVFLYLTGHLFLAVSLLHGVWGLLGTPVPEAISTGVMALVVRWAAWAGYRSFRPAWWSAIRMAILPVVWVSAAVWGTANTVQYFAPSENPLPGAEKTAEIRTVGSRPLRALPFGDTTSIANFEGPAPGSSPERWNVSDMSSPAKHFQVRRESGNQLLEVAWPEPTSEDDRSIGGGRLWADSLQLRWNPRQAPYLAWRWKIFGEDPGSQRNHVHLNSATNASVNVGRGLVVMVSVDTVRFGMGFLRRTFRYVYSPSRSTDSLYVERAEFKNLPKVSEATFVLNSAGGVGVWQTVRRNIAADYRQAFGERVPSSVDHLGVIVDFDPPFDEAHPDTLRGGIDDLRVYTTPPRD